MKMLKRALFLLPLALASCGREEAPPAPAGSDTVAAQLEQLAERAKPGTLGVMIANLQTNRAWGVNPDTAMPMQSVFKLPLAIMVMDKVDRGELALEEKVSLTKDQLSIAHSPIAERFGEKRDYTIEELVRAAVAQSDNTAADVLMKRVGGPGALTAFFRQRGIEEFRVDRYEYELQPQAVGLPEFSGQWIGSDGFRDAQEAVPLESQKAAMTLYLADPRDRITPRAAVRILALLDRGKLVSPASTSKLMEILRSTTTGANRLKAGAPTDAIVYHKTGSGPNVEATNSASNDIGIIQLKDGRKFAVAALLSGSRLPAQQRDAIIAEVARIAAAKVAEPANVP